MNADKVMQIQLLKPFLESQEVLMLGTFSEKYEKCREHFETVLKLARFKKQWQIMRGKKYKNAFANAKQFGLTTLRVLA